MLCAPCKHLQSRRDNLPNFPIELPDGKPSSGQTCCLTCCLTPGCDRHRRGFRPALFKWDLTRTAAGILTWYACFFSCMCFGTLLTDIFAFSCYEECHRVSQPRWCKHTYLKISEKVLMKCCTLFCIFVSQVKTSRVSRSWQRRCCKFSPRGSI